MSVSVGDIISEVKNFVRNQNLSDERAISGINGAIDFIAAHLGLPGHEREYTFNYFDTQIYNDSPDDLEEAIYLRFDEDRLNDSRRFVYKPAELLYKKMNNPTYDSVYWGVEFSSGSNKLIVITKNSTAAIDIDNFDDSVDDWTGSLDATNLSNDDTVYKEGAGSLKFDIDTTLSGSHRGSLTKTMEAMDLSSMNDSGYFLCWVYLPNVTDFTSISLNWGTDSGNYWKQTVTTQFDGSALEVGWNELAFAWADATLVGSPVDSEVTWLKLDFDYEDTYVSTDGFRVDYLRIQMPDKMKATYYTIYRGKDSEGNYLTKFTASDDTFLFGDFCPAIRQLVAAFAAVIINPQILVDNTAVKNLYKDFFTLYVKKYPKKKISNLVAEPTIMKTNHDN